MATTFQHNPVLLQQQEDEDIALANYLTSSLRFNPQPSQQKIKSVHAYHNQQPQRVRVSSNASNHSMNKQKISPPSSISSNGPSTRSNPQRKPSPRPHHNNKKHPSSQSHIKSSSESIKSNHSNTSKRRHSTMPASTAPMPPPPPAPMSAERRSSIESTTSAFSIRSDMSMGTKLSLSKRLRKVFSMNNLKSASSASLSSQNDLASLAGRNGSSSSVASSVAAPLSQNTSITSSSGKSPKASLRRRSIASLSSLFQKATPSDSTPPQPTSSTSSNNRRHSSGDLQQLVKEDKKRPDLRVDTTEPSVSHSRKGGLKVRSSNPYVNNGAPDSPNSAISARSFTRSPPSQQRNFTHEPGLPSPTPSTASSKYEEDYMTKKPAAIGLQYGIGLHSSPKLKPASSSTSSLPNNNSFNPERRVQFCTTIQVHETFAPSDYDRRCDTSATCQKLTPISAMKIKQELNEYKLTEMDVHVESRQYTHFFL